MGNKMSAVLEYFEEEQVVLLNQVVFDEDLDFTEPTLIFDQIDYDHPEVIEYLECQRRRQVFFRIASRIRHEVITTEKTLRSAPKTHSEYRREQYLEAKRDGKPLLKRPEPKERREPCENIYIPFTYHEGDSKKWDAWIAQFVPESDEKYPKQYLPGDPSYWVTWVEETLPPEQQPIFLDFLKYHPTLLSFVYRKRLGILEPTDDLVLFERGSEYAKHDAAFFLVMLVMKEFLTPKIVDGVKQPLEPFSPAKCNLRIEGRVIDIWRGWTSANTLKVDAEGEQYKDGKYNLPMVKEQTSQEDYDAEGENRIENQDLADTDADKDALNKAPEYLQVDYLKEVTAVVTQVIYEDYFEADPFFHEKNRLLIAKRFFLEQREVKEIAEELCVEWKEVKKLKDYIEPRTMKQFKTDERFLDGTKQFALEYQWAATANKPTPGADRLRELWS
jgi:hypothetical protein